MIDCSHTCELRDACDDPSLSGSYVVFDNASPFTITAIKTEILGYVKSVCMRCTSNMADVFDNPFDIVENRITDYCSSFYSPVLTSPFIHPYDFVGPTITISKT